MSSLGQRFNEIWLIDFEFDSKSGERPRPVCLVAHELRGGRRLRVWQDDLLEMKAPPYRIDRGSLVVAYYASAEMGCHLALGWALPANILDLYAEFRNATNGRATPCGNGLLGALAYWGLGSIEVAEKEEMRQLILRGGPWSNSEQKAILNYCASDVDALIKLLGRMAAEIDTPRAMLRGRYMTAAANMEHRGVPIDKQALGVLRESWDSIQDQLIGRIDAAYGVFEGRSFTAKRWARWLEQNDIAWPRLQSGNLALDDDTFREMARAHPTVAPIRELRVSLSQMRLSDLAVGSDGRNRTLLSAFKSKTGRNQPSNSRYIFGPSAWLRSLIRPEPGFGLAYIDWSQQEFGIAAALSGDPAMLAAYNSGDPYLAFAKQAGAVPPNGTKITHSPIREQFKACVLAVQYGMGAESLAVRISQSPFQARELLRMHRETYQRFWRWSDAVVDHAMGRGRLWTVFGWNIQVEGNANPRSLRNFPMQANGAEMLRLACCLATERGFRVCAPVHDAILIEAPLDRLEAHVRAVQQAMEEASALVLGGFKLRSDVKLVRYPERYEDPRGKKMWDTVWSILAEDGKTQPPVDTLPVHLCTDTHPPADTRPSYSLSSSVS
jgi:hypothetical protein